MRRLLVALLAFALASPATATRELASASGISAASLRAAVEAPATPASAEFGDARPASEYALDARAPHGVTRAVTHGACPENAAARVTTEPACRPAPERGATSHVARALAFPYDATAPPMAPHAELTA